MAKKRDIGREKILKAVEAAEKTHAEKGKITKKTAKKATKTRKKTTKTGEPFGRPTKYDPKLCQELENQMAEGFSFEAACGHIGICKVTGYNWIKEHEDFLNAKKRGETLGQLWWEQQGKKGMFWGKDFNATVWVFAMKNRTDWNDKRDLNIGGQPGNPIQAVGPVGALLDELDNMDDEDLEKQIETIMERKKNS
jgi:hypothetical protein